MVDSKEYLINDKRDFDKEIEELQKQIKKVKKEKEKSLSDKQRQIEGYISELDSTDFLSLIKVEIKNRIIVQKIKTELNNEDVKFNKLYEILKEK